MPANTRQWARRKFDMSMNNIDTAQTHLAEVGQVYEPEHPEITQNLVGIMRNLEFLKKIVEKQRETL